jgi:bacterioferritin
MANPAASKNRPPLERCLHSVNATKQCADEKGASMQQSKTTQDIFAPDQQQARQRITEMLAKAYWMEMETVMNYLSNSVNLDGVRAREISESLQQDVQEELGHAQMFAERIKELYGVVPGSQEFKPEQVFLQPPAKQTDVVHVIKGVIQAESGAIAHYTKIIEETDGIDWVTQDMVIDVLHDEQGHRRLFEGFLREFQSESRI